MSGLRPDLTALLLRPINETRVFTKDGQHHLAAWDVRAHLIRCFGFAGWSAETLTAELIHDLATETKNGKPARKVAYRAHVRLVIHETGATYSEWAVGESVMPDFKHGDAHDFALKTAESQALKRCAINLGSQFGLSLYDSGNPNDVVRGVFGVRFDDDVKVDGEGSEPGVVVDQETGEIIEDSDAAEVTSAPATNGDEPAASDPNVALSKRTGPAPTSKQVALMWVLLGERFATEADQRDFLHTVITRDWTSTKTFTATEVRHVLDQLGGTQREAAS